MYCKIAVHLLLVASPWSDWYVIYFLHIAFVDAHLVYVVKGSDLTTFWQTHCWFHLCLVLVFNFQVACWHGLHNAPIRAWPGWVFFVFLVGASDDSGGSDGMSRGERPWLHQGEMVHEERPRLQEGEMVHIEMLGLQKGEMVHEEWLRLQ